MIIIYLKTLILSLKNGYNEKISLIDLVKEVEKSSTYFDIYKDVINKLTIINDNLKDQRGEHKNPGEYRKSQNWIGGSRPGNAVYVPPIPSKLMECLSDSEKFINNSKINTPDLIKIYEEYYDKYGWFYDSFNCPERIKMK